MEAVLPPTDAASQSQPIQTTQPVPGWTLRQTEQERRINRIEDKLKFAWAIAGVLGIAGLLGWNTLSNSRSELDLLRQQLAETQRKHTEFIDKIRDDQKRLSDDINRSRDDMRVARLDIDRQIDSARGDLTRLVSDARREITGQITPIYETVRAVQREAQQLSPTLVALIQQTAGRVASDLVAVSNNSVRDLESATTVILGSPNCPSGYSLVGTMMLFTSTGSRQNFLRYMGVMNPSGENGSLFNSGWATSHPTLCARAG